MMTVFADTLYWVAIVRPNDPWKELAQKAKANLGNVRLVTTDEVLTEFITLLSTGGANTRRQAAAMVRAILNDSNVKVIAQSRDTFLEGVRLYEMRPDKEYGLVDCVSMNAMRSEGIKGILTKDNHFRQEGFDVLIA